MNYERVEAAAKAMYDAQPNYEDDPIPTWESLSDTWKSRWLEQSVSALTAADAVERERVQEDILWFNNGPDKFLAATCGTWLQPGEELVVRKRRGT